jgi:hypothetical protein
MSLFIYQLPIKKAADIKQTTTITTLLGESHRSAPFAAAAWFSFSCFGLLCPANKEDPAVPGKF